MTLSNFILRITDFYRGHGLAATVRRAWVAAKRTLFASRMVVFYCDLNDQQLPRVSIPEPFKLTRVMALGELNAKHLQEITSVWNPKLANRRIRERFEKGASLWLVESEEGLAGYGWSLEGGTIEPYFFPLAQNDVHLFDFHVFPSFRGRGVNPKLTSHILTSLAINCRGRAFIEAAEWNHAQLSSLRKTPFRCLGKVRTFTIFGRKFESWSGNDAVARMYKRVEPTAQVSETAGSNEK